MAAKKPAKEIGAFELQTVRMTWTGATDLLMHNVQLANPRNRWAMALKEAVKAGKVKGADPDLATEAIMHAEFMGGAYWSDASGYYLPGLVPWSAMWEGAKKFKKGVDFTGAVRAPHGQIPLSYAGPKTPADRLAEEFYDYRIVDVNGSKIMRCRPKFEDWSLTFSVQYDAGGMSADELISYAVSAGRFSGVGDARRLGYGRFDVSVHP